MSNNFYLRLGFPPISTAAGSVQRKKDKSITAAPSMCHKWKLVRVNLLDSQMIEN